MTRGAWVLVGGESPTGPIVAMPAYPVSLVEGGDGQQAGVVSGHAPCNYYGFSPNYGGGAIADEIQATAAGCVGTPGELERAYYAAISVVDRAAQDGDELVLTGPDAELRFLQMAPVRTEGFVGIRWRLHSMVEEGEVAPAVGDPAYLLLADDGSVTGSLGCRSLHGRWTVWLGLLSMPEVSAGGEPGEERCHTSPTETPLLHQDSSITQVLSSGFSPEVDGARVVLRGRGLDLVYQRAG